MILKAHDPDTLGPALADLARMSSPDREATIRMLDREDVDALLDVAADSILRLAIEVGRAEPTVRGR